MVLVLGTEAGHAQASRTAEIVNSPVTSGSGRLILPLTGGPQRLLSLQIRAAGGSVTLTSVSLRFTNGRRQRYVRRITLTGRRTFPIRAVASNLPVRAIEVTYLDRRGQVRLVVRATVPGRTLGPIAGQSVRDQVERNLWARTLSSNTPIAYENYLRAFPRGRFAAEARRRIAALAQRSRSRTTNARRRFGRAPSSQTQKRAYRRRSLERAPSAPTGSAPAGGAPTGRAPPAPSQSQASRADPRRQTQSPLRRLQEPRAKAAAPPKSPSRGVFAQRETDRGAAKDSNRSVVASRAPATRAPVSDTDGIKCVQEGTCTAVRVFFGTNRRAVSRAPKLKFGWRDTGQLHLGGAIVTVPRATDRQLGHISRPSWFDILIRRMPREGDPSRHFVIVRDAMKLYGSETDFLAAVADHMRTAAFKDHAFVFVHGYRVPFDDALMRTAQLSYDLGTPNILKVVQSGGVSPKEAHRPFGTAFLYSWPSKGKWAGYPSDIENARRSVELLEEFLEIVLQKTGAKKIHLIAHSMGNVALLNALKLYAEKHGKDGAKKVEQLVLAAPDMAPGEFARIARTIRPLTAGMTLYASANDAAMLFSRQVHEEPRIGDIVNGLPAAIVPGVDTIDISLITTCYFCSGHTEYVEQPVLLNDIATLLRTGVRPPNERTTLLAPTDDNTGSRFWRYIKRATRGIVPGR